MIARTREDLKSCYDALSNEEVAKRLEDIEADIHVMVMLRRMRPSQETAKDASVLILQIAEDGELRIHQFSGQRAAARHGNRGLPARVEKFSLVVGFVSPHLVHV